ncbi:Pepco domain-containing protein [Candidatus Thiothrix anitrata]|uniref:Pepco domain-containing protein n=1 Tax=Candidatus Thiothrix anitrata TaxID=2823902 RepID=A0ABX7X3A1_9GAMM|nr:hypothetical protein [Candidatus Thiothrix anitrata]QTR49757.1 hypothetical protein J8380_16245 [Candidatus Thiothrix anitrata]
MKLPERLRVHWGVVGAIYRPGIREIDSAELANKMQELSEQLSEVFSKVETVGKFKLNKVELGIEISGEGGINLIASGKVGGKGSIKLVFEPA